MSYNFAVVNNNSKPSYNPGNSKSISVSSDVTINNNLQINIIEFNVKKTIYK